MFIAVAYYSTYTLGCTLVVLFVCWFWLSMFGLSICVVWFSCFQSQEFGSSRLSGFDLDRCAGSRFLSTSVEFTWRSCWFCRSSQRATLAFPSRPPASSHSSFYSRSAHAAAHSTGQRSPDGDGGDQAVDGPGDQDGAAWRRRRAQGEEQVQHRPETCSSSSSSRGTLGPTRGTTSTTTQRMAVNHRLPS